MTNQEAIRLIRNLSTMCVFTDAYGEPIDSDAYYEAVDMAISALQAQDSPKPTAESVQNVQNEDLISRKAAIEVIEEMQMPIMRSMFPEEQFVFKGMSEALSAIKDLPSAQPEIDERTEEFAQNVPKEDLISRKAAIDVAENAFVRGLLASPDIQRLPSAQPETATGIIRYLTDGLTMWYACDACGVSIGYKDHYCRNCGRKLKHEK